MLFATVIVLSFFFFNDTATTEIYTLSLHDALPIYGQRGELRVDPDPLLTRPGACGVGVVLLLLHVHAAALHVLEDRKSTRLNSSHANISYAVFCLKKKKKQYTIIVTA